jgi:threonine dehydrogenase-like Zn-dependent dehydrogenase
MATVRAFMITGPRSADVVEVPAPEPGPGQVVIDVERAGVCGTDAEIWTGDMVYLQSGETTYPVRIGHEFSGVVSEVGPDVDERWLGERVTADVMVGCGACERCRSGRHHVCAERHEVGVRDGWPGALAERMSLPARALHRLPRAIDPIVGAFVEPGGNAYRAVQGADVDAGQRLLILGPGTIGLLAALVAGAQDVEVHVVGITDASVEFARSIGIEHAWTASALPALHWDAVIDATNDASMPATALELVEPGRRVVFIGLAGRPSLVDSRIIALKDLNVVGVLGASAGLAPVIELFASGAVDPRPLLAATVGLDDVPMVLAGDRRDEWGPGPKIHVDPRAAR